MSSLLFSTYKSSWQNTQPENICDTVFQKVKGHGRTINRASVYPEAAVRRVFKKGVMRNFAQFTRKHLYCNPFLVFSCEFCEICKSSTGRLLLIIAVSTVVKRVLANETVNYEIRIKAYVIIWARSVSY